jgi:hypothetical protein
MESIAIGIVLVAVAIVVVKRKKIVWHLGGQRPKRTKSIRRLFRHPIL